MSYLDPEVLARLEGLRLYPRFAEKSAAAGSKLTHSAKGSSLEFVDYKIYTPGDDPRRIDWKVFGRKDRYFLRSYEGETNCNLWVVLDASRSMSFKGPQAKMSKWDFACKTALGLVYVALKNRDACGLALFADGLLEIIRPKSSWEILSQSAHVLDSFKSFGLQTAFEKSFKSLAGETAKRSLMAVISDFFGSNTEEPAGAFEALAAEKHELLAMRIVDPFEEELSGLAPGPCRLLPLEVGREKAMEIDFQEIQSEYRQRWRQEEQAFARRLGRRRIDYAVFRTLEDPGSALARYLTQRSGAGPTEF
ncbi:MAG: DUF58 domain-containing protein [Elusimicrobia bacterium]|nr:DUF58 domain-containing protein [Elusimicrobiota bacterium]